MKRELSALLLFLAMLAVAAWNLKTVDRLSDDILHQLSLSQTAAQNGDTPEALRSLDSALSIWLGHEAYTHIFLRHTEIDSCTDAFYELRQQLLDEAETTSPSYEKLRYHIQSIRSMEHPSFGSVL